MKNIKNNILIQGTLILTMAGIISRVLGFFYRIYLTRVIGSQGIGLMQIVMPVIGLVYAICSASIQTAISKYVSGTNFNPKKLYSKKAHSKDKLTDLTHTTDNTAQSSTKNAAGLPIYWLKCGFIISIPLTILLSVLVYNQAALISTRLLLAPECEPLLKILSISFLFSTIHNCTVGYYYGMKKSVIPAISQLIEQIVRILTVFLYIFYCQSNHITVTVICAIIGNLAGEIAAALYCCLSIALSNRHTTKVKASMMGVKKIFVYSLPLTANRVLMHLLQSGEAILVPAQLLIYGYSKSQALSYFGILTGMALPFIMFPTAITNSLSVLLLPTVSSDCDSQNKQSLINTVSKCIALCIAMGIISTFLFIFYGAEIGAAIFKEPDVYGYITVLAWLCPFIYLTATLGSTLNGMGKTSTTCIQNIIGIIIRLACLVLLVPKYGIPAYLIGILVSQIFVCISHYISISRTLHIKSDVYDWIVKPLAIGIISITLSLIFESIMSNVTSSISSLLSSIISAAVAGIVFLIIYFKYQ